MPKKTSYDGWLIIGKVYLNAHGQKEGVKMKAKYKVGQKVLFDIGQGLCTGKATISACEIDIDDENNFLYRLETSVSDTKDHRRKKGGELWVNEFELRLQD